MAPKAAAAGRPTAAKMRAAGRTGATAICGAGCGAGSGRGEQRRSGRKVPKEIRPLREH